MARYIGAFSGRPYDLYYDVNTSSQNVANNTSTVSLKLYVRSRSGYGSYANSQYTWYANGTGGFSTISGTSSLVFTPGDYTGKTVSLLDTTRTITHNADGTKSMSVEASMSTSSVFGSAATGWHTYTLTTIPRASTSSLAGGNTANTGSAVTINTNRASTAFTHTLQLRNEANTAQIGSNIATGVGASYSWTPAHSLLPTSTTGKFILRTITYNGSTNIGTKDTSITLNVPSGIVPTISSFGAPTEQNSSVSTHIGAPVQNKSVLKFDVTAAAGSGASLASDARKISWQGHVINSGETITPSSASSTKATATVTDSRSRTASQQTAANITVLPYSNPSLNSVSIYRGGSTSTPSPSGTSLWMTINASAASLIVSGSQKNLITVSVSSRVKGVGSFVTKTIASFPTTGVTRSGTYRLGSVGEFANTSSYEVRVSVSDRLTAASANPPTYTVSTASVLMHLKGDTGVGIGKYHENGTLDVGGPIYMEGKKVLTEGAQGPVGQITMFGGASSPTGWLLCNGAAVSRTTYAALFAAIGTTYGAGNGSSTFNLPNLKGSVPVGLDTAQTEFNALGKTGGAKTHTLTQAEMPSHTHTASTSSAGGHRHRLVGGNNGTTRLYSAGFSGGSSATSNWGAWFGSGYNGLDNVYTDTVGAHTHTVTVGSTGSGNSHNNLQPYVTLNYIIKAL